MASYYDEVEVRAPPPSMEKDKLTSKQIEDMVKETDPGRDRGNSAPIKIDRDRDVGFLGGALYRCLAHVRRLRAKWLRVVTGVGVSRHCCRCDRN